MDNVKAKYGDKINFASSRDEAIDKADALVIATEWQVFRNPDFDVLADKMNNKVLFDGRNLYDLAEMQIRGFFYSSMGRKTVKS